MTAELCRCRRPGVTTRCTAFRVPELAGRCGEIPGLGGSAVRAGASPAPGGGVCGRLLRAPGRGCRPVRRRGGCRWGSRGTRRDLLFSSGWGGRRAGAGAVGSQLRAEVEPGHPRRLRRRLPPVSVIAATSLARRGARAVVSSKERVMSDSLWRGTGSDSGRRNRRRAGRRPPRSAPPCDANGGRPVAFRGVHGFVAERSRVRGSQAAPPTASRPPPARPAVLAAVAPSSAVAGAPQVPAPAIPACLVMWQVPPRTMSRCIATTGRALRAAATTWVFFPVLISWSISASVWLCPAS